MLQMGNSVITFQVTAFSVSLHFQMMLIFLFILFNFLVNASRFSVEQKQKAPLLTKMLEIVWGFWTNWFTVKALRIQRA